jgi:hypothetical protein
VVIGDGDVTARMERRSTAARYGWMAASLTAIVLAAWALTRRRGTIEA